MEAPTAKNKQAPCPICHRELELATIDPGPVTCPCRRGRRFEAVVFDPPPLRPPNVVPLDGEASQPCARHEGNAATGSCERCGIFLCALCEVPIDGKVLCPDCFERLDAAGELKGAARSFRDFRSLAFLSLLTGLLFSCVGAGFLLGPLAIFFAVRSMRQHEEAQLHANKLGDGLAIAGGVVLVLFSIGWIFMMIQGALDG